MSSLAKLEIRAIAGLASIFSLRMLGLFMILPVFALYAQQLRGVTPAWVGISLGIYGLTQALFQIPLGALSDHLGRKPVIIVGLVIFSLGSLLAAFSDAIMGVALGRALQGAGAVGCVLMALAADLTRQAVRTQAMAGIGITIGLSFALAMVLGPLCEAWIGVRGIFGISAFLGVAGIGVLISFVPTPKMRTCPMDSVQSSSLLAWGFLVRCLFKNSDFVRATVGILILHTTLTALFLKMPPQGGLFYLSVLLASLVSTLGLIRYAETHKKLLLYSVIVLVFSECLVFYSIDFANSGKEGLGILALSLWLFFTAFNFLEARLPALVSSCVPAESKGTALGIFSSAQFLGLFLGGALGGYLDGLYGIRAVAGFCIVLGIFWLKWCFSARK